MFLTQVSDKEKLHVLVIPGNNVIAFFPGQVTWLFLVLMIDFEMAFYRDEFLHKLQLCQHNGISVYDCRRSVLNWTCSNLQYGAIRSPKTHLVCKFPFT